MWQRLSVLALCGMSALWADACDGLPTLGDGTGNSLIAPAVVIRPTLLFPQADPEPPQLSYRLSVKPGLPLLTIEPADIVLAAKVSLGNALLREALSLRHR
jgi:hypothetical protein